MRKPALAVLLFSLVSTSAAAQCDSCLNRTVTVNVFDGTGNPVKSLGKANFRAVMHKREVGIVSASYDAGPHRIVILLDTSGSMISGAKWKAAVAVAEALVSWASPQSSLALLNFTDHVEDKIGFSHGRKEVADELAKLESTRWREIKGPRKTAVLDALLEALSLLQPAHSGDAICLISDSYDNASETRQSQMNQALLTSGVRLFGFAPLDRRESGGSSVPMSRLGPGQVRELTETTGGSFYAFTALWDRIGFSAPGQVQLSPQDREALLSASQVLSFELSEFYRLQIALPEVPDKARRWTLELVDSGGKRNPHFQLVYPRLLANCQSGEK